MDIVLVSCAEHMRDTTSSEPDDQALLAALAAGGFCASAVSWDDPHVDWAEPRLCVMRSAWDYHHRLSQFLGWAEEVARVTTLLNPLPALRWNTHKAYLRALESKGVPIVPTEWLAKGVPVDLARLLAARGWQQAVLKPMVSTNAFATRLLSEAFIAEGQEQLDHLLESRDVMLQPFLPQTGGYGERSLVFISGELTHAFRKRAALGSRADRFGEIPVTPTLREAKLAHAILRHASDLIEWGAFPPAFLFARVDLLQDESGEVRLMELELVEPRLRLDASPWALARLLQEIAARCSPGSVSKRMVPV
jgi:hypothetical protein